MVHNFESVLHTTQKSCNFDFWKKDGNRSYLIEVYKMMHGFTDVPGSFFQNTTDSISRGHNLKLVKQHCHTDSRLYFISLHIINS